MVWTDVLKLVPSLAFGTANAGLRRPGFEANFHGWAWHDHVVKSFALDNSK